MLRRAEDDILGKEDQKVAALLVPQNLATLDDVRRYDRSIEAARTRGLPTRDLPNGPSPQNFRPYLEELQTTWNFALARIFVEEFFRGNSGPTNDEVDDIQNRFWVFLRYLRISLRLLRTEAETPGIVSSTTIAAATRSRMEEVMLI